MALTNFRRTHRHPADRVQNEYFSANCRIRGAALRTWPKVGSVIVLWGVPKLARLNRLNASARQLGLAYRKLGQPDLAKEQFEKLEYLKGSPEPLKARD